MLFYVDLTGSRWLDLPLELWVRILSYTAPLPTIKTFFQTNAPYQLVTYYDLITHRDPRILHINGNLRQYLLPTFYKHAALCGRTRRLLVPPGSEPYMQTLVIHIPESSLTFSTIVRSLYSLPIEARSRMRWLGVILGEDAKICESEYGALSGAFPQLQRVSLEVADTETAGRQRLLWRAFIGQHRQAHVTTLTSRGLEERSALAALVVRCARYLEVLDVGSVSWATFAGLFEPTFVNQVRYPQLRQLLFRIVQPGTRQVAVGRAGCQLPLLESASMDLSAVTAWQYDLAVHRISGAVPGLYDLLLRCPSMHLRSLALYYRYDARRTLDPTQFPCLQTLTLTRLNDAARVHGLSESESELLTAVLSIRSLCEFRDYMVGGGFGTLPLAPMRFAPHAHMRVLDLRAWAFTMADVLQLLERLPRLDTMRLMLRTREGEVVPDGPPDYHPELRMLWVDAMDQKFPVWTPEHLDLLVTMVARMPALQSAWLFKKAIGRVRWMANKCPSEDLVDLLRRAKIGQCGWDDCIAHGAPNLLLA